MWNKIKNDLGLVIIFGAIAALVLFKWLTSDKDENPMATVLADSTWHGPSLLMDRQLTGPEREMVVYGHDLIVHTARYLGPQGSVAPLTNGMNCQNCHLDGGRKAWGNNYGAVYSTYPKLRERSGKVESIFKRVNDCMERSLNGQPLDSNSREYQAIYAYIKWLGKDVAKGEKPHGSGIEKLPMMDRAADPEKGKTVYVNYCQSCHGANGEGQLDGAAFVYPPLWGPNSYNNGAGLYRLSNFAGFIKSNMPFQQATHELPKLSNEEAWDVAAFVNSQPRPSKDLSTDWPNIAKKPFDHPYGPYADGYSEHQHKYGPWKMIKK